MKRRPAARLAICILLLALCNGVSRASGLAIATSSVSFPAISLNGSDQVITGNTNPWRADATGESNGWHITVASTDFTSGGEKNIPVSNFEIRLLDTNISRVSGDINGPISTQTTFSPLSAVPIKITSAAVGEGDGIYDLTPDFRLNVPAETYTGSYASTVTVVISVGP